MSGVAMAVIIKISTFNHQWIVLGPSGECLAHGRTFTDRGAERKVAEFRESIK